MRCRLFSLTLLLLTGSTAPLFAEPVNWVLITEDDGTSNYISRNDIINLPDGNKSFLILKDFQEPIILDTKTVHSEISLHVIDCSRGTIENYNVAVFGDRCGSGSLIQSETREAPSFTNQPAVSDSVFSLLCRPTSNEAGDRVGMDLEYVLQGARQGPCSPAD